MLSVICIHLFFRSVERVCWIRNEVSLMRLPLVIRINGCKSLKNTGTPSIQCKDENISYKRG